MAWATYITTSNFSDLEKTSRHKYINQDIFQCQNKPNSTKKNGINYRLNVSLHYYYLSYFGYCKLFHVKCITYFVDEVINETLMQQKIII